ncbi:Cys-tRNA(Pro) deacylase [soil metagenome]
MAKTTPATLALGKAGVTFTLHTYDYDPDAGRVGLQAAQSLGADPARVLKTLMAQVDGRPVCAVLASDQEVAMKKLAAVFGGKAAAMMKPADAERMTGYRVGGVSPFGQKRLVPTVVDEAALLQDQVFVNGGQRGLQVQMAPADLVSALDAKLAEIT